MYTSGSGVYVCVDTSGSGVCVCVDTSGSGVCVCIDTSGSGVYVCIDASGYEFVCTYRYIWLWVNNSAACLYSHWVPIELYQVYEDITEGMSGFKNADRRIHTV